MFITSPADLALKISREWMRLCACVYNESCDEEETGESFEQSEYSELRVARGRVQSRESCESRE